MPSRPPNPEPPACPAILWNTGKSCRVNAAPGSPYCPAHLALMPPEQWVAEGYAAVLDLDVIHVCHD